MSFDTAQALVILNALTAKFDMRVQSTPVYYPELCTIVPSRRSGEDYGWIGAMPGVREWVGDRIFKQLAGARFHLDNKQWENSILIEKTAIADDVLGMYGPAFEMLADEATKHPDELLFTSLVAGSSALCYDGQYFFDTDHSQGDSGSNNNDLTYAAATGTVPTVAEAQAALAQAVVALLGFTNDKGKLFNRPTINTISGLTVLLPLALWNTFNIALNANIISQTSNVLIAQPKIVVSPYLTDAKVFYVFKTDTPIKPFVFQAREPLGRQMKGLDDRESKDVKFMCDARYNLGYLAWWNAVRTEFT